MSNRSPKWRLSSLALSKISRSPDWNTRMSRRPTGAALAMCARQSTRARSRVRLRGGVARGGFDWAVHHLHRESPAFHRHHRRPAEELREGVHIDGGAGDHHLQVAPLAEQPLQAAEQEVHVQTAFVGLVHDHAFVAAKPGVGAHLGKQQPVRHHRQPRGRPAALVETHGVAHLGPQGDAKFRGDSRRDGARREAPRLGVGDHARGDRGRRRSRPSAVASSCPSRSRRQPRPPVRGAAEKRSRACGPRWEGRLRSAAWREPPANGAGRPFSPRPRGRLGRCAIAWSRFGPDGQTWTVPPPRWPNGPCQSRSPIRLRQSD